MDKYIVDNQNNIHLCDQISKVEYEQYGGVLRGLIMLGGAALVYVGFNCFESLLWQAVMVVLGVWLAISYNYPFVIKSERRAIRENFAFPSLHYVFQDDGFLLRKGEAAEAVFYPYADIDRLLEDDFCLYILMKNHEGNYILKQELQGFSAGELAAFLEERSGCVLRRRKEGGLNRLSVRFSDELDNFLLRIPACRPLVEKKKVRQERQEREAEELRQRRREEKEEAARVEAENLRREQQLHEELSRDPQKMEEFQRRVSR